MTSMWDYRETVKDRGLAGFDVEATDGRIGKLDEASDELGASCLVVDTGFWIFGKKRLLPAGFVTRVDRANEKVHVGLTKDEVKSLPDFDPDRYKGDWKTYRRDMEPHYQSDWSRQHSRTY
jgi:hypothetical protein